MSKERPQQRKPSEDLPLDVFELNPLKLDKHFLEQPKLVITYGIQLAEARDAMDRARSLLDVTRAEAEKEIQADPQKFDVTKTTVDAIKSAVERHEDVQMCVERLQRRKHDVDILQAMVNALEHRKRSLEGLVQLHGQQYFASPQSTPEFRKTVEEQNKAAVRRRLPSKEDNE